MGIKGIGHKIYISGKITGLSRREYLSRFEYAEKYLKNKGYSVINPAKTNDTLPNDTTWDQYMDVSYCLLNMCDTIFMLTNWKDSEGANREYAFAKEHNYGILYESDELSKDETRKYTIGSKWWLGTGDAVIPVVISGIHEDMYRGREIDARSVAGKGNKYEHLTIRQKPEWFLGRLTERGEE